MRFLDKPKPNKALAEFLEAYPAEPQIPENSFTVRDYCQQTGCTKETAIRRLRIAVGKGFLNCVTIRLSSSSTNFYTVVEDKKNVNGRTRPR